MALYESLTAQSTPAEIAAAYAQFVGGSGGDTTANQDVARSFLESRGIAAPMIETAYNQFLQPAQVANTAGMGAAGIGTNNIAATNPVTATPNYEQMVRDAYGSIGRIGFGAEASNIDQAGFDYWLNTLKTGQSTPEAFQRNFQTAIADYLATKPDDKYSTYVTDYLQRTNNPEIAGIQQLYKDVLGRSADPSGLGTWYKQFGAEISPEERAQFEASAKKELDSRVQGLYTDFLGRDADAEGMDYWRGQFGSSIDDAEREQFRQAAAAEINKQFGVTGPSAAPTTEGILSGFKYANQSGITEDKLKKTLGEDVFNTYKTGLADFAKTGIANILADDKLSFDEARRAVNFGRELGYDAQKLADLTGTDKKVFDTIYKNYDDTTNKIVDSVFAGEDVKTNDDKVVKALALQKEFGFTDEDLAKAADLTVDQVKGYLDPVRNFGDDLKSLLSNTDSTSAEVKKTIADARANGAINKLYGTNLDTLDTRIAEIEDRWKDFKGVEPMHAQRIYDQIGGQREKLGNQYYRGTFGDPMKMAATLAEKGIDTLADIGQKEKFESVPAEKRYFTKDGQQVFDLGNGTFGVLDAEGGSAFSVPKSQVKTEYGRTETTVGPDGESTISTFVPLSDKEVDKDGNYQRSIGKVAIDKDTGKEISELDGTIAAEKSGRWNNRRRNELNVQFTKEGVPVVYSTQERTGLGALVQDLAPILSMALPFVLPGVGSALSSGLAGMGGSALATGSLANAALTQGILGGGLATLGGGQFEKGFLSGAVSPVVGAGISKILPTNIDPALAKTLTSAGTGAVRGAIQGGDFNNILSSGITSGLADYGVNAALGASGLTPQQLNFVTGIAAPLLQGNKITPLGAFGALVNAGQQMQRTPR